MSEIKTTCRGTSRLIEAATMTHEEYLNLHTQGEKELRAAYEALQKELELEKMMAVGYIARGDRLEAENAAQAKRIAELEEKEQALNDVLELMNIKPEHFNCLFSDVDTVMKQASMNGAKRIADQAKEIESLRKQVETLGHKAPTASGFCSRDGGCVCGGDLPRIRESCGSWVKPASKNGE